MEDFQGHEQYRVYKSAAELLANAHSLSGEILLHNRLAVCIGEKLHLTGEMFLFLGKQGIPFRGHEESITSLNKGIYLEFLHFRSRECAELSVHLSGVYIMQAHKAKVK